MDRFSTKFNSFAIDISDSSLRIAKLKKQGDTFGLACFGESRMPAGAVDCGEIKKPAIVSETIEKLLKDIKGERIDSSYAVCLLPEEKSFLDVLEIPKVSQQELSETVKFAASSHIPVPIDDVYFDFEKIVNSKDNKVLIVATPKKIVDSYINALTGAGIQPVIFELESLAIVRSLLKIDASNGSLLIIDLGQTKTNFIIFSGQSIRFTSTIPVSSHSLAEAIAKKFSISLAKAEELQIKEGLDGQKKVFQAMKPAFNTLVSQINSYLSYYQTHIFKDKLSGKKSIEKVLLCGGGANLSGLPDFLTAQLKLGVELADPFTNISRKLPKNISDFSFKKALSYSTVLGLALRASYGN